MSLVLEGADKLIGRRKLTTSIVSKDPINDITRPENKMKENIMIMLHWAIMQNV